MIVSVLIRSLELSKHTFSQNYSVLVPIPALISFCSSKTKTSVRIINELLYESSEFNSESIVMCFDLAALQ